MMAFTATTAEDMRLEVVRYLDFIADKHIQNTRMVRGSQAQKRERDIANVIMSLACDFRTSILLPSPEVNI